VPLSDVLEQRYRADPELSLPLGWLRFHASILWGFVGLCY
jgi:hypothetical protein